MYGALRSSRRIALVLTLVLAALCFSALASPAAFAAAPSISAKSLDYHAIQVTGSGFSWGGQVQVQVYDNASHLLGTQNTTASATGCSRTLCTFGGTIGVTMPSNACWQTVRVIAYDYNSGTWSNWSNVYVYCIS